MERLEADAILAHLPAEVARPLTDLLGYPETMAGGFMTPTLAIAHLDDTVAQVRQKLVGLQEHPHGHRQQGRSPSLGREARDGPGLGGHAVAGELSRVGARRRRSSVETRDPRAGLYLEHPLQPSGAGRARPSAQRLPEPASRGLAYRGDHPGQHA
jgi:hypothetical protein